MKLAVDDYCTADARAQGDHHHVPDALPRPGDEFAPAGAVGVVFQKRLHLEAFADDRGKRHVQPTRHVGEAVDEAGLLVQRARHAHADGGDRGHLLAGKFDCFGDAVDKAFNDRVPALVSKGGAFELGQDLVVFVHDGGAQVGAAQIHTDEFPGHLFSPRYFKYCPLAAGTWCCGQCAFRRVGPSWCWS